MKTKQRIKLEIKEISAEGSFEGLLSPYNVVDQGKDVVEPGAYDQTIKLKGPTRPLLWQHDAKSPIGQLTLEDREDGLWVKGQLLLELEDAKKAYLLIKNGIISGLSIGFESVKDSVEAGVRHLKEIKLWEGSIVTFPMATQALIVSVKARGENKGDFNEELADIQMMDAGYQMRCALMHALDSMLWSGATKDEVVSSSEVIIQQFGDAYITFLPLFIDLLAEMYGGMETMSVKKALETKAGAQFSAANKTSIKSHASSLRSVADSLDALFDDEADKAATTSTEAGAPVTPELKAADQKTEPAAIDHSALSSLLSQAKESFQWNQSNSN